jgi:putative membrane protein
MRKLHVLSAVAAVISVAVALPADPTASVEAQRGRGPGRAAMTYVAKAAASDLYEIESSRLALDRAQRPAVREFARMLVTDHTRTTELVAAAARADGVTPLPPQLEPAQRTMLRQLQRHRGPGFDRVYLDQQLIAHQQALTLHRNYARNGAGNDLRRVARNATPVIQGHLGHARQLARGR